MRLLPDPAGPFLEFILQMCLRENKMIYTQNYSPPLGYLS